VTVNDQGSLEPDLEPLTVAAVKPRAASSRVLNLALGLAVVIAIAGVAFAVGRGTAPVAAATGTGRLGAGNFPGGIAPNASGGPGGFGGGFGGGGATGLSIEGTVTAVDADSVTITTSAGTTIELSIDDGTEYHQQAAAASSDVATGSTVVVQVSGFAGRGGQPGGANASAAPSAGTGGPTGTATDITVVP
jgi:hypothetical protein